MTQTLRVLLQNAVEGHRAQMWHQGSGGWISRFSVYTEEDCVFKGRAGRTLLSPGPEHLTLHPVSFLEGPEDIQGRV